ncbi:uncharacterized protein [Montipora foliosa]|uniref:uncharacterized protein n=1 Tax=Montipora foliosa TaxID=591990 RepID=UPI0035F1145E
MALKHWLTISPKARSRAAMKGKPTTELKERKETVPPLQGEGKTVPTRVCLYCARWHGSLTEFSEEHKIEWSTLLSAENAKWSQKDRAASWPLQDILAKKANLREKQKLPESGDNGLGFLGQKPEGVPVDVDNMVRNQVAPVREVYGGVYRRPQPDVVMVDSYEGVVPGSIVAVNLDGNYKPPHQAEVQQIDNTSFTVQWLKGGYKAKWVPWHGWTSTQIPKESVIYFDIDFDENGKLKKEAAQYLRRKYKELQKN